MASSTSLPASEALPPRRLRWTHSLWLWGGALVATSWVAAGIAIWRGHDDAIENWRRFLSNLSAVAAQHADQTLAAADAVLARVVEQVEAAAPQDEAALRTLMGTRAVHRVISERRYDLPQIDVVSIVGASGDVINFSRQYPPPAINLADRDYFQAHRANAMLGVHLSVPVKSRGAQRWTFYLSRKLKNARGDMIGLALVGIESDYFEAFYRSVDIDHEHTVISLMRRDGALLARLPHNEAFMGRSFRDGSTFRWLDQNADQLKAGRATAVVSEPRVTDPSDSRLRILAPTVSSSYPLVLNIMATDTLFLATWRRTSAWIAGSTLVFDLVLLLLAGRIQALQRRREEMLAQLQAARVEAEAASRTKSAFLANMSHEIRTPMNGVLGMTELLLRTPLTAQQQTLAASAHAAGGSMLKLLDDILDLSKIEAGKVDVEHIEFDLHAVLADQVSLLSAVAQRKSLAVQLNTDPGVPRAARGDPRRLTQVLINLLGNAIKFTPRGHVELRTRCVENTVDSTAQGFRIRIEVIDTGIGIAPSARAQLFQPFSQADGSMSRRYGGSGLGLAITQHLVQLMGGSLSVDSEVGVGSTFAVELPLLPASSGVPAAQVAPEPEDTAQPLSGCKVLLAEDNPVNLIVALAMLESLGLQVDSAQDGAQAVQLAAARPYDLILMDCQMPEVDGFEATRQIRAKGMKAVPIAALTANAMNGDRQRCLDAGMDDYLAKPLTLDALEQLLRRWLPPSPRPRPAIAG